MKLEVNINNIEETEQLAEILGPLISGGTVMLLKGDLGAGKTTFAQCVGITLGVRRRMSSPTFNIIKSYNAENFVLHHMDCYRLENSDEDLGFDEYFNEQDVSIIEWPGFIEEFLPDEYLSVTIEKTAGDGRLFTLESNGAKYDSVLEALQNVIPSD
ncbi:tRNA (adenosine(37)-N6)-threonylcarbamoyltransferase complex ATPase subunit type 1 TsaE [Salinicoccus carnicancri]|uniref:tRNA (adenosine(37)-N6)-threonylcarbamoyltransferase complex ATPase subunit type 1 TsaE n=1 Tax=Salinicoccus carnicancri TaxID=558170 RepID=UPI0002F5B99D|nr:tRNA (adenosine(37)-N6)-threonylcarbamoyltransferase complex ATPase subunit type 1 TsaE [Salinicoccus carnicancri]